jgi:hypothetical protein
MTQLAEIELLGCDASEPTSISVTAKLNSENIYPLEGNFIVAPNPVGKDRIITLQLTSSLTDTEVTITMHSIAGKQVHSSKFWSKKEELQLEPSLPPVIYIIEAKNNISAIFWKKIILK